MRKLRLANFQHVTGKPFNLLRSLEFAAYEENIAHENTRKLHEGEIDIAIIPSGEFALHGGYVGLDFGIALHQRSDRLMLYANDELHNLNTVYIYENTGSSGLLLRLLLNERWNVTPRIVRTQDSLLPEDLGENEGVLVMHDNPVLLESGKYPVAEDLIRVWHDWTGLPFVFLIWATRPGVMSLSEHRAMNETFHVCNQARNDAARQLASKYDVPLEYLQNYYPDPNVYYHLDEQMIEGLNHFYRLCAEARLLPAASYASATYTLFGGASEPRSRKMSVNSVLANAIEGQRLSICEGTLLAEEASLSDLGLAADLLRSRLYSNRTVNYVLALEERSLEDAEAVMDRVTAAYSSGVRHMIVYPERGTVRKLDWYCRWMKALKLGPDVCVEGIGVGRILEISQQESIPVRDVVSQLIAAGLDALPSWGGGMLIDTKRDTSDICSYSAHDWVRTVKWLHRFGARTSSCLMVAPNQTWEDRLIHLHKLRTLQDLTSGFRCFYTKISPEWSDGSVAEVKLRATIIGRLFLDNVASIHEVNMTQDDVPGALSLWFGANEVRVKLFAGSETAAAGNESVRQTTAMLQSLWNGGLSGPAKPFEALDFSELH